MKLEFKVLIYSMINNFIISVIKVIGGIFFNLSSLFADGMHTFSDFITDIVCLIGSKISKKRPTKVHPFGFGKVEYLTNLFVGIVLLLLGIFIIFNGFKSEEVIPPLSVIVLLIVVFILKLIAIFIMHKTGDKINSQLLITSVKESAADLYSTIGVIVITILLQFSDKIKILKYSDMIGSILIGIIVLKSSFQIIRDNSLLLIGEVEDDKEKIDKVKEVVLKEEKIEDVRIELIKYGSYYSLQLFLVLNPDISLLQATQLENNIKKDIIRHRWLKIKYVSIFIKDKI